MRRVQRLDLFGRKEMVLGVVLSFVRSVPYILIVVRMLASLGTDLPHLGVELSHRPVVCGTLREIDLWLLAQCSPYSVSSR